MEIAVIGAGAAGLAAAMRLAAGGAQVTLLEREARAGGKLRTELLDDARVDVGVQMVSSTHTALRALATAAGATGLLQRSPGRDALWRRERPQPITYGSVASMVASGALPTTLKLKMAARYLPYLTSQTRGLDANDPAATGGIALDSESIGAWGRREVGDDFVELLVYPLLAAYYGALPEETSAPVYHALARVGMEVSVLGAAGGFGTLADAWVTAAESAGVRFIAGAEVSSVVPLANAVGVEASAGAGVYDAVVVAVPANRAASMLRADGDVAGIDRVREWLAGVSVRRSFTVSYRLDRAFPGDYFGLSFPRTSSIGRTIAAVCIQSRKLPGLVPHGDALVVLPAPAAVPALYERSDDTLADDILGVLDSAVPGVSKRVTRVHVQRFEDAYSIYAPGHLRRIAELGKMALPPRVAFAGDYLTSASVEGAVRAGDAAAAALLSLR